MNAAFDPHAVRAQVPILARQVNGRPLVYLDNAASAQKPEAVIAAMADAMRRSYANVHRGLHTLANEATTAYEAARARVAQFLNAPNPDTIVLTKGATHAINIVAGGLAPDIRPGDEIVLSAMEHHANIVPWHLLRERRGAVLRWVEVDRDGRLDMEGLAAAIGPRTRMVAVTHMSNVLGSVVPAAEVVRLAHAQGALVLLDGCQAAVHGAVDVQALGADYYAVSAHKLYGPTGIGALYGRAEALERLAPFEGGGEMIDVVGREAISYNTPPHRFEAGTPPIVEAIGLHAALNWLAGWDAPGAHAHVRALHDHAVSRLVGHNWFTLHGAAPDKGPILSFSVEGAHPHDLAQLLDQQGVAIRAGHHCAQPLMAQLGVSATARASFALYNTLEEVDVFVDALERAHRMLS